MSPDQNHDKSALLISAIINFILFVAILYLLVSVFKRFWRRQRQRHHRNSENVPLLNIDALANLEDERQHQEQEQQQHQQEQHQQQQQQQQQQDQEQQQHQQQQNDDPAVLDINQDGHDNDLESVDLQSLSSDPEVCRQPKSNWFQKMFQKK